MKRLLVASAICLEATQLWASGFQVIEQGASNVGTSLAGAAVNANNDASAAFWNPSSAFFVESDFKIDAAANFLLPVFKFQGEANYPSSLGGGRVSGSNGGNAGTLALVPNAFATYRIQDNLMFTMSMTSPFGLETMYDDDFVGRMHGVKSDLMTIDVNPSLAFKMFDWLMFSAGASGQYLNAILTQYIPYAPGMDTPSKVLGHSWSAGFNLGMTIKYNERGRLGISYRSRVNHEINGSMYVPALGVSRDIKADLAIPNVINVGIYQRLWGDLEDLALMCDYSWTQWSCFDYLRIQYDSNGALASNTEESWKDTSRVSFGVHYYLDDDITFRLGTAFDESPVKDAAYRTVRIPDSDRIWVSCGIGYKFDNINIDLAYAYIMFDDVDMRNVNDPAKGPVNGSFAGHSHIVSFQVGYAF